MRNTSKRIIAAALTGVLLLPTIATAEAGSKNGWNDNRGGNKHHGSQPSHQGKKNQNNNHGGKKHGNNDNLGAAVAAGVIGLAAGAVLLGATRQPAASPPPVNYYPQAPYPGRVQGAAGYQPWSPAWYQHCSSKYRSFNPSTGTYTTYGGEQRFCQ
ncbi:BA14K family protein [Labrenzia sp. 011]|uniref:BA14K family protein n=1 Tax=Labrenzia sp. 011 TaxID=2171494 RepID=UPI000D5130FF|nr:BA14K family protein [Labrenzia sp. 011]PVB61747.1 BA14K family protein [Labrenzia sp. 011]